MAELCGSSWVASSPNSLALVLSGARIAPGIVIRAPDKTSARESGDKATTWGIQYPKNLWAWLLINFCIVEHSDSMYKPRVHQDDTLLISKSMYIHVQFFGLLIDMNYVPAYTRGKGGRPIKAADCVLHITGMDTTSYQSFN